ncbi:MAG TPA: ACP S-malonyltransferase, partial [Cellulomonas sp.]
MLAVACPGQGAQSPGMLAAWLDVPGVAELLGHAGDVTGIDLVAHGTVADADAIRDTAVAQPLLVATALASLRAVLDGTDAAVTWPALTAGRVDVVAGHSVGELAAAAVAGVLTDDEALTLVAVRGAAMARAAAAGPTTGMSAVLGGDPDEVAAAIAAHGLVAANVNGGGQVVAAGSIDALVALAAAAPARAKVVALQVAGAFHTDVMAPAVAALAAAAGQVVPGDPTLTLLGNADGEPVSTGAQALARLVAQVALPVRWDLCQARMAELGVTGLLEVAPAGVLTGLAKRVLPG